MVTNSKEKRINVIQLKRQDPEIGSGFSMRIFEVVVRVLMCQHINEKIQGLTRVTTALPPCLTKRRHLEAKKIT